MYMHVITIKSTENPKKGWNIKHNHTKQSRRERSSIFSH